MKGNVWQVAVVALVIAVVLPALNIGFGNAAAHFSVANEPATIDYETNTTVDADAFEYNESITVTNASDGTELDGGSDYEWYPETGTIDWLDTASTSEGDDVELAYDYRQHDDATRDVDRALSPFGIVMVFVLLLTCVGAIFAWHAMGSNSGGGF